MKTKDDYARWIVIIVCLLGLAFCSGLLWNPHTQDDIMEAQ